MIQIHNIPATFGVIRKRLWILFVLLIICGITHAETVSHGSLRDLERRARQAPALAEHAESLQRKISETETTLQEAQEAIKAQDARILQQAQRLEEQEKRMTEYKKQIEKRDLMLRLFRSGAFEYYQVAEGDTLASIATNPMVYGDASKAVWLAYANAMEENAQLQPGTVLIIPRFAEGVQYEF